MARQVLTIPDVPAVFLTQTEGDARYPLLTAPDPYPQYLTQVEGDGRYLQSATATTTYVPLAGGSVMTGLLGPTTTNANDLGTTALRWRKLWAVDGEFTDTPTVGGTALPTFTTADARYLQAATATTTYLALAGGTLTGDLVLSEATPTVSLKQAGDTQPRSRLTDTALGFGPGGSTAPDVTLTRTGTGAVALANTATRLAVNSSGTVTLTPDASQQALELLGADASLRLAVGQTSALRILRDTDGNGLVTMDGPNNVKLGAGGGIVHPNADNAVSLGASSRRWTTVYAVAGTINTSSREAKEAVTPLDPAAALEAVRNTTPVTFDYKAPARGPDWYDLPDDPEQAAAVLEQRYRAAPLEEGARHQRGFVLKDETGQFPCDPMFETGDGQSNAANSVGVLLAALREIDRRLTVLETP